VLAWAFHTYAELCAVKTSILARIPDGLGLIEAAALPLITITGSQLISVASGFAPFRSSPSRIPRRCYTWPRQFATEDSRFPSLNNCRYETRAKDTSRLNEVQGARSCCSLERGRSSIFLLRIVGALFMPVNSKCAHQVRHHRPSPDREAPRSSHRAFSGSESVFATVYVAKLRVTVKR
jgi:hypothetical protein